MSYTYESGSVSKENIKRKLLQIFLIYSLISILIFVILNIAEIRLFNSLNLSMTLISNGGFLPTNSLGQIFNEKNEIFLLAALFLSMINIFFLFNIIKLPFHIFFWKTINYDSLAESLKMTPFVFLGLVIGVYIVDKIPEKYYSKTILILTAVSSIFFLFS